MLFGAHGATQFPAQMKESEGLYRSFTFIKQALLGLGALLLGLLFFGYVFFMRHVDAPRAWAAADREIHSGMLHFSERVERKAKVYERRPTDYFRGANGIMYATNERIIFIGIAPADQLESQDAPPILITEEYPNDTLLSMQHRRLFLLTAHGVVVQHRGFPRGLYGSNRGEEKSLDGLIDYVNAQQRFQRAAAASERTLRKSVTAMIKEPRYYTVRRGDALFSIAKKFGTTPDRLRAWNKLPSDRVKIGQRLLVKPAK